MERTAAAATRTVTMAAKTVDSASADSMTMAATTTVAAVATKEDSACGARGTGRTQQQSGAGSSNAWQARWADVALAGGAGADFTCRTPRLGLVGDVRCARPSPWRRALTLKMMSTSLCLCDVVTPAVIRERRRGRRLHRYRGHRAARVRGGRCAGDPPLGIAAKVGAAFKLTSECS